MIKSQHVDSIHLEPVYLPESKQLRKPIHLKGIRHLSPFTCWSWNVLGISFALSAYTGWAVQSSDQGSTAVSPWLLRCTLILWEIAAPCTLLVATIVRYVIWPAILKKTGHGGAMVTTPALLQHNANVFMAMSEVALLGGLPVHMSHISLPVLFGVTYVFFTWAIRNYWNPSSGSAFLYFFLDTTLGIKTTLVLFILLLVQMTFYTLFSGIDWLVEHIDGHEERALFGHCVVVLVVCFMVCRVRN